MKIIDRYILRQFFLNFAILMVVVQGLFVSIDFIVNLDAYLRAAQAVAEQKDMPRGLALLLVLADYYGPMCLLLYVHLSGIVVAAAMGFTVVNLQRTRELTAVVASGISLRRVAMMMAAGGLAANLLAAPVQEWVLPGLAHKALRSRRDLREAEGSGDPVRLMSVSARHDLLSADAFDLSTGTIVNFWLLERGEGRRLREIRAPLARWNAQASAWEFEPAAKVSLPQSGGLAAPPQETVTSWPTEFSPTVIHACRNGAYASLLSLGDMNRFIGMAMLPDDLRNNLRRAWWARFTMPIFGMLLMLVSLTCILSRVPVVTTRQGLMAAGLSLGCWAVGLGAMSFGGLPPILSAWLPVAAIGALVAWRLRRMET